MSSDEGSGRRPKRRCARSSRFATSGVPSAVHYVGYVEDDETPEMIMAKFVEFERIQDAAQRVKDDGAIKMESQPPVDAQQDSKVEVQEQNRLDSAAQTILPHADDLDGFKTSNAANQTLSDDLLLEIFKQTSMFNVRTAMQDNAVLMGIDEMLEYAQDRYGEFDPVSDDDDFLRSFWSDGEDDIFDSDDEFGKKRARKRGASAAPGRGPRAASRARHSIVTAYNPTTQALVRRRVRVADPNEIVQVRIPLPPIPLSWGRTVRPYVPLHKRVEKSEAVPRPSAPPEDAAVVAHGASDVDEALPVNRTINNNYKNNSTTNGSTNGGGAAEPGCTYVEIDAMETLDVKTLPTKSYVAAIINPAWWHETGDNDGHGLSALGSLARLPLPRLVPEGFVFVWTPKRHVGSVCKLMSRWGYVYIENLTWVYMAANNKVLKLPSRFARRSHMTLYMFRMPDKGKSIELRHQRNSDVMFDCLSASCGAATCGGVNAPEETFKIIETLLPTAKGKLLELWAPRGSRRPGWTHVVDTSLVKESAS